MSSQLGGNPTTQRTYNTNINVVSGAGTASRLGAAQQNTAPHGIASRINTTESRFYDTAGGLTYSASAISST